jgi:hypothetical protein
MEDVNPSASQFQHVLKLSRMVTRVYALAVWKRTGWSTRELCTTSRDCTACEHIIGNDACARSNFRAFARTTMQSIAQKTAQ